jgi:hypothetical protein
MILTVYRIKTNFANNDGRIIESNLVEASSTTSYSLTNYMNIHTNLNVFKLKWRQIIAEELKNPKSDNRT